MPSQKVRLEICGSSYVVSTNDSEEYLLNLAERLDTDMKRVMQEAPNASVTSAAVISALGYLDEAAKSSFGADNMRAQIQDYLEDAAKAKMAAEEARREAERLRRELAHYQKKQPKEPPKEAKAAPARPVAKPAKAEAAGEELPPPEPVEQLDGQIGLDDMKADE